MDREATILAHLPQVLLIATKIHRRLPPCVLLQELVSIGTLGLIAAVDKFDASAGVKLKSYAEYKIRGAILDALRKLDHCSRPVRTQGKHIEAATLILEHRLGRNPSQEEIADELGLPLDDFRKRHAASSTSVLSLENVRGEDGMHLESTLPSPLISPEEEAETSEQEAEIRRAIERLPYREQEIVRLVFWGDQTLREIAIQFRVNESRISQLKAAALQRLRNLLAEIPAVDPRNRTPRPISQIALAQRCRAAEKLPKTAKRPEKLAA